MGMFDSVYIDGMEFQTKALECMLCNFEYLKDEHKLKVITEGCYSDTFKEGEVLTITEILTKIDDLNKDPEWNFINVYHYCGENSSANHIHLYETKEQSFVHIYHSDSEMRFRVSVALTDADVFKYIQDGYVFTEEDIFKFKEIISAKSETDSSTWLPGEDFWFEDDGWWNETDNDGKKSLPVSVIEYNGIHMSDAMKSWLSDITNSPGHVENDETTENYLLRTDAFTDRSDYMKALLAFNAAKHYASSEDLQRYTICLSHRLDESLQNNKEE